MPDTRLVLMTGTLVSGYRFWGPFKDVVSIMAFLDKINYDNDWAITELRNPETMDEYGTQGDADDDTGIYRSSGN